MDHYITVRPAPAKLAILAGAFNPPTRAHLGVADAALAVVDEVLFALPRAFPHKEYKDREFETRLEWLRAALAGYPRFSLAVTEGGLFIEIAREARAVYGTSTELFLLCGRDVAERIVGWDYGEGDGIQKQLEAFELLVASRGGVYERHPRFGIVFARSRSRRGWMTCRRVSCAAGLRQASHGGTWRRSL
jgi:nicotinic acid mononucleotide adenylyltransferase